MAITTIDWHNYKQNLDNNAHSKQLYGEIFTPFSLIESILNLLPATIYSNPELTFLDVAAGSGFFSMILFKFLNAGLKDIFSNLELRHEHILKNMMFRAEFQEQNCKILNSLFKYKENLFEGDFLSKNELPLFDVIIGNPPYNINGIIKVPTNKLSDKKHDGKSIWFDFVKKSIDLLKPGGHLCMIIPSIWLKPDKQGAYNYLTSFKLEKIHCFNNTETNRIFKGQAQTPTCYFHLIKEPAVSTISLYDTSLQEYISYPMRENRIIPLFAQSIIVKMIPFLEKAGGLKFKRTNMPSKKIKFRNPEHRHQPTKKYPYKNIHTCILNKCKAKMIFHFSDSYCVYNNIVKLVLAHKMYGFPYLDKNGECGISNRDVYVITDYTLEDLYKWQKFLSTKTALYLFEATRYRMKYLERYIFELIPDITKLDDFPIDINDENIAKYFLFNAVEQNAIKKYHKKTYVNFC